MNIRKIESNTERRILTAMIVNDTVCGRIASRWDKKLFRNKYAQLVGGWCKKHFDVHEKAPGKDITVYFEAWCQKENRDETVMDLTSNFLTNLSEEYKTLKRDVNPTLVLDQAAEFFGKNKLTQLQESIVGFVDSGDLPAALDSIAKFGAVQLTEDESVDVLLDRNVLRKMMAEKSEPIIVYPDALGSFYGDCFCRNSFVVYLAPEKRGKTFILIDNAVRALEQGRRVAMFGAGDMTTSQTIARITARVAERPVYGGKRYRIPRSISPVLNGNNVPDVEFDDYETEADMTDAELDAAYNTLNKRIGAKKGDPRFKLSTHPANTLSVAGIQAKLRQWKQHEDFEPDVIIIDYADILLAPNGYEGRDKVNATWIALNGLRMSTHTCLVSATQADAEGGITDTLTRDNFSEDKRKLAHVTDMIGLNQTPNEKAQQVYRFSWIVRRADGEHPPVHAVGCLGICHPCMYSALVPISSTDTNALADARKAYKRRDD